ncbi:transcriptional regulator, SarA/Rot family [Staphylococcus aureus]|uniref:transcriptional regulator, SarA/Rot family n=1 Tax=Staphylococcus aureus TaxID=1280 RepID=UPI00403F4EDF
MKKVNNDTVFGILQLETLLGDINSIFSEIENEYKMSREEILILLTLWQKGSMTLKEMDRFVEVKPYKRTRTYNNLVELEWIYKERPVDDERTVIIHFNEKLQQEKVELLNFISDAIASRATAMQNSLNAIIAV